VGKFAEGSPKEEEALSGDTRRIKDCEFESQETLYTPAEGRPLKQEDDFSDELVCW